MTQPEVLATFTQILRDLLSDDSIELTMATTRPEVPAWDSFAYISFIAAVEQQLGIRFRVANVEGFKTVGDIVNETLRLKQK